MIDNEKKSKSSKLFVILLTFSIVYTFVFMSMLFIVKDIAQRYKQDNNVEVDTTSLITSDVVDRGYSFTSSTIPCLMSYVKSNTLNDVLPGTTDALCKTVYSNVVFAFDTYADHLIDVAVNCLLPSTSSGSWYNTDFHVYYDVDAISKSYTDNRKFTKISHIDSTSNDYYVLTTCKFTGDFNYNIVKISTDYHVFFNLFNWRSTRIYFYDINGNSLEFQFAISDRSSSVYTNLYTLSKIDNVINGQSYSYILSPRTYYITNNFSDNTYYNQGYIDGYSNGEYVGYDNGYSSGYSAGEDVGFENGRQDGILHANDYSFFGLIGAIVDVPIRSITSLLNFEIFGFNFFSLFSGLITLSIIFLFVRLVFFRK